MAQHVQERIPRLPTTFLFIRTLVARGAASSEWLLRLFCSRLQQFNPTAVQLGYSY
jgi:hypothetical protein